jgi:hypothetical protein
MMDGSCGTGAYILNKAKSKRETSNIKQQQKTKHDSKLILVSI